MFDSIKEAIQAEPITALGLAILIVAVAMILFWPTKKTRQ